MECSGKWSVECEGQAGVTFNPRRSGCMYSSVRGVTCSATVRARLCVVEVVVEEREKKSGGDR